MGKERWKERERKKERDKYCSVTITSKVLTPSIVNRKEGISTNSVTIMKMG
jgi:hypothetical protein